MRTGLDLSLVGAAPAELGATNASTGVFYPGNGGPKAAIEGATWGQTVLVNPGTYNATDAIRVYKKLDIKCADPNLLATFTANGAATSLFYVGTQQSQTLFEGIGFTGNVQGEYGANIAGLYGVGSEGIAYSLTVRRCKFWECQHGILSPANDTVGTLLVEDSEFRDNGNGTAFYHNMYVSAKLFTLRGCWVHCTFDRVGGRDVNFLSWGHLVKSRAVETVIEGNRLTMEKGEANRCIDLPNGGDVTIRGNLLEMVPSKNSNGGGQAVSFGVEEGGNPAGHKVHKFRFEQNTLVNHPGTWAGANTRQFLFIRTDGQGVPAPSEYSVRDNVFAGLSGPLVWQDFVGAEGRIYEPSMTENTVAPLVAFPGHTTFDFRMALPAPGSRNWATRAYQHPCSSVARTDSFRGGVPA